MAETSRCSVHAAPPRDVNEISRNCVEIENTSTPLFKPEPEPAESDSAENEDIEDKEAEANELFEFKAKFREDVEVFLETAEENWNKESFR